MKQLRVGVIGCGVIGQKHTEAATNLPHVELVAVADINEKLLNNIAARFKVPKTYTSAEALIKDETIEAVILALPTNIRGRFAPMVLKQNKHLLLEKPAAMNAKELEGFLKHQTSQVAACASSRFALYESALEATKIIKSGALGKLRLIRCRALLPAKPAPKIMPPAWRLKRSLNGGGILLNWGVYDLDYLMSLTDWQLKPRQVLAQTWTVPKTFQAHIAAGSDAETYLAAFVRCEGGEVLSFERGEYMAAVQDEAWQIIGEEGSLRLRMVPDKPKELLLDKADARKGVITQIVWQGKESYADIHTRPLDDFATAILTGQEPATSLKQALSIQRLTDAIYVSAEQGTAVMLTNTYIQ